MTVKELRDLLSGFPNDVTVFISYNIRETTPPFGDIDFIEYDHINEGLYLQAEL